MQSIFAEFKQSLRGFFPCRRDRRGSSEDRRCACVRKSDGTELSLRACAMHSRIAGLSATGECRGRLPAAYGNSFKDGFFVYSLYLMFLDYYRTGNLHWFMLFYLFILVRWLVVFLLSFAYRPYVCKNKNWFVSVIVPAVDESPELFSRCLEGIAEQTPNEIIVVINGPENPALRQAAEELRCRCLRDERLSQVAVKALYTPVAGKRNAIRLGLEAADARSEITVLVDSDVTWTENTLEKLLMPFSADEGIGGVTSRQKIRRPELSLLSRVAAILEEIRAEGTMKAMSANGKVGCLPGRTIAFRTEILRKVMPEFMTERFLGIHKEVSDDRSLTNLTLKMGYQTVLQDSAVVYTEAPENWKKFARQQLRWAEGSQYNNLRMSGWMLRNAKRMFFIYWTDMLMPFLFLSVVGNQLLCRLASALDYSVEPIGYSASLWMVLALVLLGSILSFGVRNIKSFVRMPAHYLLMIPVLTLVLSLVLAPIRILGLMKCADSLDWGTRDLGEGVRQK